MLTNDYFEFHHFEDRDAWLAGRRALGIGSSDAAAILGVSRFGSPLSLYYKKIGMAPRDPAREAAGEERRAWGHILEEPIAKRYAATLGRFVAAPPPHSVAVSKTYPFALASVDRFVNGTREGGTPPPGGVITPGVVEIKNADLWMAEAWSEANNNEPPIEYQIQLQHQLMVTGCRWGSIAALIGGNRFVWADLPRDEALIEVLKLREAEFWQRVLDRRPPDADGNEATRNILRDIYPRQVTGEMIVAPPDALEWHEQLVHAKKRKTAAELDIETYANKFRQLIGDATGCVLLNGYSYTNKAQKTGGYTVDVGEARVLRSSAPKAKK